jgi:hypothetical protein
MPYARDCKRLEHFVSVFQKKLLLPTVVFPSPFPSSIRLTPTPTTPHAGVYTVLYYR